MDMESKWVVGGVPVQFAPEGSERCVLVDDKQFGSRHACEVFEGPQTNTAPHDTLLYNPHLHPPPPHRATGAKPPAVPEHPPPAPPAKNDHADLTATKPPQAPDLQ